MPFSHESEHTKLMTSLIINLPMAEFYRQSLSCEVINKSQGDINSNSNYFPMYARCSISIARLFFEVSTSIFCMLIWPRHHRGTSHPLFSNLRCASRMIHPGNCSPAPSPVGFNRPIIYQSLLLELSSHSESFVSEILVCTRTLHPQKLLLRPPLPVSSLDYFF